MHFLFKSKIKKKTRRKILGKLGHLDSYLLTSKIISSNNKTARPIAMHNQK